MSDVEIGFVHALMVAAGCSVAYMVYLLSERIFKFFGWRDKNEYNETVLHSSIYVLPVAAVFLTLVHTSFFEYPKEGSVPFRYIDGERVEYPDGTFHPPFNAPKTMLVSFVGVHESVRTITENPKVREISYSVSVDIMDRDVYLSTAYRRELMATESEARRRFGILHHTSNQYVPPSERGSMETDIKIIVRTALLSFNDKYSTDLARFSNHMELNQQTDFLAFVSEKVNPILAKEGLKITAAGFKVK